MKNLSIAMLFLFASISAHAEFGLGLKAGVNFATHKADGSNVAVPDFKSKTGFVGGGYVNYFFGETFGIQPEVLFSQKGAKIEDVDLVNNLTYVDIPVLVRIHFLKVLDVHVGPQFSFLANATQDGTGADEDLKEKLKNSEVALAFGAGVNLPLKLNLTARYILGLTDISEIQDVEIKNSAFQLTLGFRIIGK
jgi:hypothetical protein